MNACPDASGLFATVDVAQQAVMRLNHMLRDWPAAPKQILHLQEATTRLHTLLVTIAHAQSLGLNSPNQATSGLLAVFTLIRTTLGRLEGALEGVQPLTAACSWLDQSEATQQDGLRPTAKWVSNVTVMEMQRELDDCYQRLSERLVALNMTTTVNTYSKLSQDYQYAVGSSKSPEQRPGTQNRTNDTLDSEQLDPASAAFEFRNSDNERQFEFLEQELSAIATKLSSSDSARAADIPSVWRDPTRQSRSRPSCTCRCHTMRDSHRSSRLALTAFKSTLGAFSLYFSASNARGRSCTSPDCRLTCSHSSTIRMGYTFPKWLYLKAVAAVFSNRSGAPELLIRVVRRIAVEDENESIIGDIERRDLPSVQRGLRTRRYTAFDTMFDGTSMILLALTRLDMPMVRLLLFEGADIFEHDDHGNKPHRDILMQIYAAPHLPLSYRQELERVMPIDRVVEATELPDLHKVVLGIRCLNLREYLRTDVDVTATDVFGRSALWYASCKGDLAAVQALLASDVQPRSLAKRLNGPVHIAAIHNHVAVLRCLLDHDAKVSVNCRTRWSFTPLMSSARGVTPADDTARELIRRGADVDAHNLDGITTLHMASSFDRASLVAILVASGADINRCDKLDGTSALATAIQANARHTMMTLLRLGADYHIRTQTGEGVAHELGKFADVETTEMLRKTPHLLTGLETTAVDHRGKTAMQVCLERPTGPTTAFASLLEAIRAVSRVDEAFSHSVSGLSVSFGGGGNGDDSEEEEEEEEDVFFDAPAAPESANAPLVQTSDRSITSCVEGDRGEPNDSLFLDINKYRFPEYTNSNGTKVARTSRTERLQELQHP